MGLVVVLNHDQDVLAVTCPPARDLGLRATHLAHQVHQTTSPSLESQPLPRLSPLREPTKAGAMPKLCDTLPNYEELSLP